jgi:hypothetical protein
LPSLFLPPPASWLWLWLWRWICLSLSIFNPWIMNKSVKWQRIYLQDNYSPIILSHVIGERKISLFKVVLWVVIRFDLELFMDQIE